jgi:hypothetical protein
VVEAARSTPLRIVAAVHSRTGAPIVEIKVIGAVLVENVSLTRDELVAVLINRELNVRELGGLGGRKTRAAQENKDSGAGSEHQITSRLDQWL